MITYSSSADEIEWQKVADIIVRIGWVARSPEHLQESFAKSTYTYFAFDDGELVGFGRTIDDGRYVAQIVDVNVDPDYQGRGIGTRIVNWLKDQLAGYRLVTLVAAEGKDGFYRKLGWRDLKNAFVWPKNPNGVSGQ